jgi:hypothetical protein
MFSSSLTLISVSSFVARGNPTTNALAVEFIFVWALLSNHDSCQQLVCILMSAHAYELARLWSRRGSIGASVMLSLGSD